MAQHGAFVQFYLIVLLDNRREIIKELVFWDYIMECEGVKQAMFAKRLIMDTNEKWLRGANL